MTTRRYRNLLLEISALRKTRHHLPAPIPFPDLTCASHAPPTSDHIPGSAPPRTLPKTNLPVGNLHKQGPILITPGMIANNELTYLGGRKP